MPKAYTIRFKVKINEPKASPDLDTLKTFFFWIARRSKGILSNHSSISTLCHQAGSFACMYRKDYGYEISEDVINRVRDVSWLYQNTSEEPILTLDSISWAPLQTN